MAHVRVSARVEKKVIHVMITLDPCPFHSVIHLVAENEDVWRMSSFEVSKKQRQYPSRLIQLPPGTYTITAQVMDTSGKTHSARAMVMIPF